MVTEEVKPALGREINIVKCLYRILRQRGRLHDLRGVGSRYRDRVNMALQGSRSCRLEISRRIALATHALIADKTDIREALRSVDGLDPTRDLPFAGREKARGL
jgi:hypothetical protein